MENHFTLAIFLFWIAISVSAGQYYSHLKNGKKATVEQVTQQHRRAERSPNGKDTIFKEHMDFKVTLESGEVVTLHLKLNKNQIGKVPVKVVSESGTEFFDNTKPRDYRFYQVLGKDHGASVMVKCENFQPPCYMAGSFYYNSAEYVIDPDTDTAHKVSAFPHTVYEMKPEDKKHAYDHDAVKVVADDNNEGTKRQPSDLLLDLLKNKRARKTKRQTTKKHYKIEIEMVVDDSIYAFWFQRMSNNSDAALLKIEQYMEQVANNMDLRFSTATTPTMEIDIVPLVITVIKDQSQNSWITNNIVETNTDDLDPYFAERALNDLYSWARDNKNKDADALVCFSRRDMWSSGVWQGRNTIGIARFPIDNLQDQNPLSGLCTGNAVSLNEDLRNGDTSATSSHELAHNMGVNHDFEYNDTDCMDESVYIMSSGIGFVSSAADAKNPWTFSKCSVSEMERLMVSVPKDADGLTCLERHSYDVNEYNAIRTSDLLGEVYSTNEQCEILVGKGSKHCNNTSIKENEICWKGIPCSTSGTSCVVKFPLSGSSCGGTNKCYQGQCVAVLPEVLTEPVSAPSISSSVKTPMTSSTTTSSMSTTTSSTTSTSTTSTTTSSTTSTTMPPTTSSTTSSPATSSTSSAPTTTMAETTTSSTSSSSSSTSPTTSTATETTSTSSNEPFYTSEEYSWLYYFYYQCNFYCPCWRWYCNYFNKASLCQRFYSACF